MRAPMKERLEERLRELREEFERGQQMLARLEKEQAGVRDSLLRIGGAIQVLEEELAREEKPREDAQGLGPS
jgi:septal ring factor EnvC (AmiA/AmiB activator)